MDAQARVEVSVAGGVPVVSTGELGDEIAWLAAQLDAGTHRLLTCIRQFDGSEEWHHQGAQSCAHWLSWRIGLDPGTAREKVRVARALGQLPILDATLATGRISYAKVRAITRVATPETEGRLVEMAASSTGAQLERICRRYRGLRGQFIREEAERDGGCAVDVADAERMVCLRALPTGMVRLEVTLHPDEADLVMKAIDKARDELRALSLGGAQAGNPRDDVSSETPTVEASKNTAPAVAVTERVAVACGARAVMQPGVPKPRLPLPGRADALLYMAETSLEGRPSGAAGVSGASGAARELSGVVGGAPPEPRRPAWGGDRFRILIHLSESLVGPDAQWEAFLEDGTLLSAEAFRRVACDGGLVPAVVTRQPTSPPFEAAGGVDVDANAVHLNVGRQSCAIPAALRWALWLRDAGCRFPGCTNRRFIHGHHLRHWAHGGETSLENLALLCSFHHGRVHEGGFRVRRDPGSGALEWFDPRGRPIPDVPSPGLAADHAPSLLALRERGVALPLDGNVNACGWDGDPVDYEAVFDTLTCMDPLFASA